MLKRSVKRVKPTTADQLFWIAFVRAISDWRDRLFALSPDTVVRWHREGFRRCWTWKCRRIGRPRIDAELRQLIRRMQTENFTWGAPRIHGELLKPGYKVCEATVSKYMERIRNPPSQSWTTFLKNHHEAIAAIDFFTVPTAPFRILYVFIVIEHARRRILYFNITERPTARWTSQQLTEAFPFNTSLCKDPPITRSIEPAGQGDVIALPVLGGLHHRYTRLAA